jgi:hypothetical protein
MKQIFFSLLLFGSFGCAALAQRPLTEHTLAYDSTLAVKAQISNLAWLTGRWTGEGFGGWLEEIWSPPQAGQMLATFRLVADGKPNFHEICLISEEAGSLVYKVKHFNPDHTGWEEKKDYVRFPLVKIERNTVWFNGLTMALDGNTCTCYLAMKQKDGSHKEAKLVYQRSPLAPASAMREELAKFDPKEGKTKLMFLGMYHFSNPGLDQFNLESDDVLTPKRQAEIEAVVSKLAAFKPTKIAVEAPFGDSATIARYKAYLAGTHQLSRNETEQIGFRLAKMLGHPTIYPIDVSGSLDDTALGAVIEANPAKHGPRMGILQELGGEAMALMGKWLKEGSIGEMLYNMNQPEFHDLNYRLYLQIFLPTVEGNNYAGADMVAQWHQRNLRIMSNLHQISCTPDDRVLVAYGQGHVPLFQRIAADSPYFEEVGVLPFLR